VDKNDNPRISQKGCFKKKLIFEISCFERNLTFKILNVFSIGSKKHEFRPKRRNESVRLQAGGESFFSYRQLFVDLWSAAARRRFLKRDVSR